MKLPYREGTWFAVPLRRGGYGLGVVARMAPKGKILLGYFFGPRRERVPGLNEVERMRPGDAIWVARFGDLSLIRGEWPVVGNSENWHGDQWCVPAFSKVDLLTHKRSRVIYADEDPSKFVREEPDSDHQRKLEPDGLNGAGAVEIALTRLLQ